MGAERDQPRRKNRSSPLASRKSKRARHRQLAFELLETRRVLSADTLEISLNHSSISENAGDGGVKATITRHHQFDDYSAPLDVALDYGDPTELTGVNQVTIPAGKQTVSVELNVVDDALLDGVQGASVTASSNGYLGNSVQVNIADHETLTVHVAASVREDGGSLAFEIERSDIDDLAERSITIVSDNAALTPPSPVTLPAGSARTSFTLIVNDNNVLDGDRNVTLTADASEFVAGASTVTVTDFETLSLSLQSGSVSEDGGSLQATVSRSVGAANVDLNVAIAINDDSEATAPTTVTIPAGAANVSFTIDAVDDTLLDGTQVVQATASATGFENDAESFDVLDAEPLTLEVSASSVVENAGGATLLGTVKRPAGQSQSPLLVTLRSSDTSRLSVPNTVTIPFGMDSALFFITPQDDQLLTGPSDVELTATARQYTPGEATVTVVDHETIALTVDREHLRENDTGVLTVARSNSDNHSPLTVALSASPSNELNLPATVTIPAGANSIDIALEPIDDNVIEDPVTVTLAGSATGYVDGVTTVDVVDVERLSLSPSKTLVAEDAGTAAIELTIIRFNEDISTALTVSLLSTDASEIQTPSQVVIPAGQRSVSTQLDAVDDNVLDGVQGADIIASAVGYVDSSTTITVVDAEALTLSINDESINESDGVNATTAVLRRSNTDTTAPLRVAIQNSDASEVVTPAVVEIPAGSQEVAFSIDAIDDQVVDGDQLVTISVVANGYIEGEDLLKVVDFAAFASWTNPDNPLDVDGSTRVNVRDALLLVHELRTVGARKLPPPTPGYRPPPWLDTNADGRFNALDAFIVIEYLNQQFASRTRSNNGEGEGSGSAPDQPQSAIAPDTANTTPLAPLDSAAVTVTTLDDQPPLDARTAAGDVATTVVDTIDYSPLAADDTDHTSREFDADDATTNGELESILDDIADDVGGAGL